MKILSFINKNGLVRLVAAAALVVAPFAFAGPKPHYKADLNNLIVVGDSLSAGFQNFSLFDGSSVPGLPPGGQRFGFASLIAKQAGVDLTLPLFVYPGLPPALKLTPLGIVPETGLGGRYNLNVQATNLSVPGFALADVLSHPFPGDPTNAIDGLAAQILGFPMSGNGCGPIPTGPTTLIVSEVECAKALQPTMILLSAGNNDALQALTFGAPPTDVNTFESSFHDILAGLTSTGAHVVVANIPDVAAVPFLVPATQFFGLCGFWPQGAVPGDFVVPNIANAAGGFNVCLNYSVRTAGLIQQAQAAVKQYNKIIDHQSKNFGATVVDINALFGRIAKKGYVVGGQRLTNAFLGGLFSVDGIHPTITGYGILANEWIATMNKELNTSILPVSIEQIAATDPLVPAKTANNTVRQGDDQD